MGKAKIAQNSLFYVSCKSRQGQSFSPAVQIIVVPIVMISRSDFEPMRVKECRILILMEGDSMQHINWVPQIAGQNWATFRVSADKEKAGGKNPMFPKL